MKKLSAWYEWVLLLPVVLPLFYIGGMMYPLMTPKTLALRAFGIIALALFSYLVLAGRSFYFSRLQRWETWIPGALLAVAYLTSLFGAGFYQSFWSTFERGDGLLTLSVCVLYFYLALLSATGAWLPRLFKAVAWVGSLAAVYMVLQWLSLLYALDLPFIVQPNGRIGGTLGNAAFYASYIGVAFFVTLAAARREAGTMRRLFYTGAALQLFTVFLAATRGTILALFLIGIAWLAWVVWKGRGKGRTYAATALLLLAVCAGLFFSFRTELQNAPIESVRRVASISLSDPTVSSRLFLWQTLFGEAMKKPLTGYGAEHIDIPFNRVYDPTILTEEWFDRSHNAYLDYFLQFGIFGAAVYALLIMVLFRVGWLLYKRRDPYAPYLLAAVAVYALQNMFVFDTAVAFWLLLMLLATALVYASADEPATAAVSHPAPWMSAILGVALLLLVIPVAIQPWRANLLAFEAYLYQIVDLPRARAATEQGLALRTYADLEFGYNAYFMYTTEQVNRLSGDDLREAYETAVMALSRDFARYPYDARTSLYLAQVMASAPADASVDNGLLSEALTRTIKESPKRAQSWYILANLSIGDANTHPAGSRERVAGYAAAKDILNRYITIVPGLAKPHFVLARLEYASGDTASASREAAIGKAAYAGDLETARYAVQYYGPIEDLTNLGFFLAEIVRQAPEDLASAYDLAKVRYLLGDKAGALTLVERIRRADSALIDSDPSFKAAMAEYEQSL
jgi:O-antigen ligase